MREKRFNDLLIDYFNWRSRYVGTRPREIIVEPTASLDFRWNWLSADINSFLEKVRRGDDLTPHLSIQPHTLGYTPKSQKPGAPTADKWLDKDFHLNTKGYHHFHFGSKIERKGHAQRTDDLLFAKVTRDTFTVIGIFSHDVFKLNSAENLRFLQIHDLLIFREHPPGAVIISNPIATSGHALHVVFHARHCLWHMSQVEPKLDDWEFVQSLYESKEDAPTKPEWGFLHLDLAIVNNKKRTFLIRQKGWN